jgi:iron complex outermembrane recepter protein
MMSLFTRSLVTATGAILLVSTGLSQQSVSARSISYELNIPAESLDAALQAVALASHHKLFYRADLVAGKASKALIGSYTTEEAVHRLLEGTQLSFEITPASVVLIKALDDKPVTVVPNSSGGSAQIASPGPSDDASAKGGGKQSSQEFRLAQVGQGKTTSDVPIDKSDAQKAKDRKTEGLEEIIVTGTLIHDVPPITPVTIITHEDMVIQGYTRLDQVLEQLPQNFKGAVAQDTNSINGAGNGAAINATFASGVNLRGLGPSATLVLLNGVRLPPTSQGTSVDLSQIPLSVIDRVEILTDGASSTYGSDAIGGVVNIITKKQFEGVEASVRTNSIAAGKPPNEGGALTGGFDWNGGNVLANVDFEKDFPLYARDRSFTSTVPNPTIIYPEGETLSTYLSLHQAITDALAINADVLASRREFAAAASAFGPSTMTGYAKQGQAVVRLDYSFASTWIASLIGEAGTERDSFSQPGVTTNITYNPYSFELHADGALFQLPGGMVRAAVGGETRHETYNQLQLAGGETDIDATRHVSSAYSEISIPIVGTGNNVPLVKDLRLDVAGRYDHYSDFGSTTNPKIGLRWAMTDDIVWHASWSKSFRAPTLLSLQGGPNSPNSATTALSIPDPRSATGFSNALISDSGNPNLQPERAKSTNVGFTLTPQVVPGLKADLSYFSINYTNKIDYLVTDGFYTDVISDAAELGSLVNLSPSLAQINAILASPPVYNYINGFCNTSTPGCPQVDPTSIKATAFVGDVNVGSSNVSGLDGSVHYDMNTALGKAWFDLDASYFLKYENRVTPTSAEFSLLNTAYNPLRFRAKFNVGLAHGPWSTNARLNYSNAYHNANDLSCDSLLGCPVASYTTVDLSAMYSAPADATLLHGIRFGVSVSNLFDKNPPHFYDEFGFNYDPTNASALGRAFAISFSKLWGGR